MAEAIITRRGGGKAKLNSIRVATPPTKAEYIADETFDPSGMVVVADIGGVEMRVSDYTYSPSAISASTNAVTISYTLDGVTKTASVSISVTVPSAALDDNDWSIIAKVAAAGRASSMWKLGDTKNLTIGDSSYAAQIIGFNHDDLNASDAMYSDAAYNGGAKKAGITFRLTGAYKSTYQMNNSNTSGKSWGESRMRTVTMPAVEAAMPSDLRSVIRSVDKAYNYRDFQYNSGTQYSVADKVFILSRKEYAGEDTSTYPAKENGAQYAFYAAGNSYAGGQNQWTRTMDTYEKYFRLDATGSILSSEETKYYAIRPAFCV